MNTEQYSQYSRYPSMPSNSGTLPPLQHDAVKPCDFFAPAQGASRTGAKKTSADLHRQRFLKKISGIVLLSHTLTCSTIAAGALNYRVREGNVCCFSAIDTRKNLQY